MPLTHWQVWVGVAVGGALGAPARHALTVAAGGAGLRWPLATLAANVLGCFVAGFATAWLVRSGTEPSATTLAFTTGFLGAFTTFSAFSVETLALLEGGRSAAAALHAATNLGGALLAVAAGALFARAL